MSLLSTRARNRSPSESSKTSIVAENLAVEGLSAGFEGLRDCLSNGFDKSMNVPKSSRGRLPRLGQLN